MIGWQSELAGYSTRHFSRRDTYGFSLVVKLIDVFLLFSGKIDRLLIPKKLW
jgi:hypothetical protein